MFDSSFVLMQIAEGSLLDTAQSMDIKELINRGIAYAILISGFLSVVFIFVGGVSFILSGGQDDKIKQAISTIRAAIIGLIITILAVVIVNTVGQLIGLNTIQYIRFEEIVQIMSNISEDIRSSGGSGSGGRTLD